MKCTLCNSKKNQIVFIRENDANYVIPLKKKSFKLKKDLYKIAKCQNCGLYFVENPPSKKFLNSLYDKKYFTTGLYPHNDHIGGYQDYFKNYEDNDSRDGLRNLYKQRIQDIEKSILTYCGPTKKLRERSKRLLDVGCAGGFLLDAAKNLGWETYGVEISKPASEYAINKLNLNVQCCNINDASFKKSFLDLITIFDVLEHSPDPVSLLNHANKILKNDAFIVIRIPNDFESYRNIFFKKIFWLIPPLHLFFFTKKSITLLLEKTGFHVIDIRGDGWENELFKDLKKFLGFGKFKNKITIKILALISSTIRFFHINNLLKKTRRHYAYIIYAKKVRSI